MVTVKTTLPIQPLPNNSQRASIRTGRLLLRPLSYDDLQDYHDFRSQPEVMQWSIQGKPDADIEATREHLSTRMPPRDIERYDCAICLADTGEFLGTGGFVGFKMMEEELGWPAIGYMLRKEAWGKGYATEFLEGFLKIWWNLPRKNVETNVDSDTVPGEGDVKTELITAVTQDCNYASQKVLRKCGFNLVKIWEEKDEKRESGKVILYAYAKERPTAEQ